MKVLLSIILLLSVGLSSAQNNDQKWTLEACIKYALDNNISIKQSELDVKNADINKSDAIGNLMPNINANMSNSWASGLTQNVTTGVLENQTVRNFSAGATASITLFDGLANIRQVHRAKLAQLAGKYSLNKMKDDITLSVANAYLQILVSKQTLENLQEQNQVTQEQIEQTQAQIDAGTLPQGDLLQLQATNADEQQQIIVAENDIRIARINLAQILLIDDYQNFRIADDTYDIPVTPILNKTPEEIIQEAKKDRYEVKIAEQNLAIAEKDLQIARGAYYPSLSGFLNFNTRESDRNRVGRGGIDPDNPTQEIGVVESTGETVVAPNFQTLALDPLDFFDQLDRNQGTTYGLRIDIPIFNGNATRNQVERRKVDIMRSEYNLQQAKLDLESNVYQAYVDAQGAAKSYEAARKAVNAQQTAFEYAKERFEVGMINSVSFAQSQLNLTQAKNRLTNAKYNYIFRLKVLELYFGERPIEYE
jgi:outer membrane protein